MSAECSGELLIGTSDHISLHRLPDLLKRYISSFPKVDLKLRCHRSETILDMVNKNRVDLGVITLPKNTLKLVSKTIWEDPMSLIFPKNHPLESSKTIALKDVASYGIILPEAGTTTRNTIEAAFSKKKLTPDVAMKIAYIDTIKGLVKAGLGISILPKAKAGIRAEYPAASSLSRNFRDATFSRCQELFISGQIPLAPCC